MTRVTLFAVDAPLPDDADRPDPHGFRDTVNSLAVLARRTQGQRPSAEQFQRFAILAAAACRVARQIGEALVNLDAKDLIQSPSGRWIGPVLPAAAAAAWLDEMAGRAVVRTDRAALARAAREFRNSRVALVAVLADAGTPVAAPLPVVAGSYVRLGPNPAAADLLSHPAMSFPAFDGDVDRSRSADRWSSKVVGAVAGGEPVTVAGIARHQVIAEVLRAVCDRISAPTSLRVMYIDGSEAAPIGLIPVRASETAAAPLGSQLTLGLLSMRHTEMDADVDGYWFRNRFVSTSDLRADIDRRCTRLSLERLVELEAAGVRRLSLIHTGFEPAAVGLYRALLQWWAEGHEMSVEPWYLRRGALAPLTPWTGVS